MTQSNYVISDTPEDLNREHKVTLTEGQISIILYILEGYDDNSNDPDLPGEIDNIFERLEGVLDNYYNVGKCIREGNDYADCVDTLVERMNPLLRDELLTLSEEQLDKQVQILHEQNEYYYTPINGVFYSTEEDDYNVVLDAGHPYLQI